MSQRSDLILFGGRDGNPEYNFLSNFYVHARPIMFYGYQFWHSEGIYQWLKNPLDTALLIECLDPEPRKAKRAGRKTALRPEWQSTEFMVSCMMIALRAKFSQIPELAVGLINTKNAPIHENRNDPFWGGGPNYPQCKDLLGRCLMQTRSEADAVLIIKRMVLST